MLIPVGLDDSRVSRIPVVAFSIIGLCVLVHVVHLLGGDDVSVRLETFFSYYQSRRYLEMPEPMRRLIVRFAPPGTADPDGAAERVQIPPWMQEVIDSRGSESEGEEDDPVEYDDSFAEAGPGLGEETDPSGRMIGEDGEEGWDEAAEEDLEAERLLQEEQGTLDRLAAEAVAAFNGSRDRRWGFIPASPSPLTAVSCLFLHAGLAHLLGNLIFFLYTAPFLEDRWGSKFFAAFYLLGGLVSTIGFSLHAWGSPRALIGASGAISAVMGAFAVKLGARKMRFLVTLGPIRFFFDAPAWIMLPGFGAMDLSFALVFGSITGVAYWAHVWGFAFGLATAYYLRASGWDRRLNPGHFDPDYPDRDPLQGANMLAQQGKPEAAMDLLAKTVEAMPDFLDAGCLYWDLASRGNDVVHLCRAGSVLLPAALERGDATDAFYRWETMTSRSPEFVASPLQVRALVDAMAGDGRGREAGSVIRDTLTRMKAPSPGQFCQFAEAAKRVSPELAMEIAARGLAGKPTDKQRQQLESVVSWAQAAPADLVAESAVEAEASKPSGRLRLVD